jgi:uncharacterized protein (TIGR00266 family)
MQTQILYRPSYSLAVVKLDGNETIQVEAGAMVSMTPDIAIKTDLGGGLMGALKRSILGGESFFMNTFQAPTLGGEMTLAPSLPGDLLVQDLHGESMLVQSGSYVASSQGVTIDTKWTGARTFFAREGLFMLNCSGSGTLIMSSYGAIHDMTLKAGERYTVDTGHLVAFSLGMGFNVRNIAGVKSTLFSGEGLVVDMTGPGRLLIQTRSADAFLTWLMPQVARRLPSNKH